MDIDISEVKARIAGLSDTALHDMLYENRDEYTNQALDIAEKEMEKRGGLSSLKWKVKMNRVLDTVEDNRLEIEAAKYITKRVGCKFDVDPKICDRCGKEFNGGYQNEWIAASAVNWLNNQRRYSQFTSIMISICLDCAKPSEKIPGMLKKIRKIVSSDPGKGKAYSISWNILQDKLKELELDVYWDWKRFVKFVNTK